MNHRNLPRFIPLDSAQLLVIEFCQSFVCSFISVLHRDWTTGLNLLLNQSTENGEKFQNAKFGFLSISEGFLATGDGFRATVAFTLSGLNPDTATFHMSLEARFERTQCVVICGLEDFSEPPDEDLEVDPDEEDQPKFREVFVETLDVEANPLGIAEQRRKQYGPAILAEVNSRFGLVENLPK